jgi:arginyl-tRNA synthetase
MKSVLEAALHDALLAMGAGEAQFVVERPSTMKHGDYATNAALAAAKLLKKNPREVAQELAAQLNIDGIKKIDVAGIGFINFTLEGAKVKDILRNAHESAWGGNETYKGKSVMVEYTDPNPFKAFHIGHLMSNAIGESIARLLANAGASVARANYQGDVGIHVAKALWGKLHKPELLWGEAYVYGDQSYEAHKQEIDALNKKIYDKSDAEINKLYESGRAESLRHFEELYQMLGTKFDFYFFESESGPVGLDIVKKHPEIFEESEGAIIFRGAHTRVFVNSQGLPTYEAKELGLLELKNKKGNFDLSLTVTANETKDFFAVVRQAAERIFPNLEGRMLVRFHGLMKLRHGKMSSRKGNVITGESLLEELQEKARGKIDVAVGAVKYAVLKQSAGRDIIFDPEKSLSLEGDSGPYVQYALVRCRALLRNAAQATEIEPGPEEPSPLERRLVHFPDVLERAAQEFEPHHVTTYITEVAAAFNRWYGAERFIVDGKISRHTRAVVTAVENTLAKGLWVLGIPTPQEM